MIDDKKLQDLRVKAFAQYLQSHELLELFDSLSLALQVVRAAQGLKIRGECWCGVAIDNPNCRGIHSPQCAAMKTALSPFAASEGTEERR